MCPRSVYVWVQRHWLRAWTCEAHRATGCCVASCCATGCRAAGCCATGCCVDWSAAATALLPSTEETGSQQRSADRGSGGFIWGVGGILGIEADQSSVDRGSGGFIWGVHARQNVGYRGSEVERGQRFHPGCPRSVGGWVQGQWGRAWTGEAHQSTGCRAAGCCATGCCVAGSRVTAGCRAAEYLLYSKSQTVTRQGRVSTLGR